MAEWPQYFDPVLIFFFFNPSSDHNGKLVAFEIPSDFRTENWTRHDIATGFKPQNIIITEGNGAPGMAFVFYPISGNNSTRYGSVYDLHCGF